MAAELAGMKADSLVLRRVMNLAARKVVQKVLNWADEWDFLWVLKKEMRWVLRMVERTVAEWVG
jgi:hypothetical protein